MISKLHSGLLVWLMCPLVFMALALMPSCVDYESRALDYQLTFDMETVSADGKFLVSQEDTLWRTSGGVLRTTEVSRSGSYAVRTGNKSPFALAVSFPDIGPDTYVTASIWRKSSEDIAKLVVSSTQSKQLYHMTSKTVEYGDDGWEKLKLEFFTPANFAYQEIKVNVWNNGQADAWFDDLEISILREKSYPEYQESTFYIEMDTTEFMRLQQVRLRAFNDGVLQSQDEDWVKGVVFSKDKAMKAKMRLKGDWLDHLYGDKWSLRIKLRGDDSWKRMKVFSVQTPLARMGVNEWYFHQVCMAEGLLTTRYGFMPLGINGENRGLYAYEDHFSKHLLESQNRREGPIVRFVEDALWDTRVYNENGKRNLKKTPIFDASPIKPFTASRIVEDTNKLKQYLVAQNLMLQYKNRTQPASEIFNVDMLAKYFALADVFIARHSLIWHNQRFYYNPVLCKLEPIAFDCFSDIGLGEYAGKPIWGFLKSDSKNRLGGEFIMVRELFNDSLFVSQYIKALEKYSSEAFLESMSGRFLDEALHYDSLLRLEYPDHIFDLEALTVNAKEIRKHLPSFKELNQARKQQGLQWVNEPVIVSELDTVLGDSFLPNLLQCYIQALDDDSMTIRVKNYFPEELTILGVGRTKDRMDAFPVPSPVIKAYKGNAPSLDFTVEKSEGFYLFVSRPGGGQMITTEIYQWPEPDGSLSPVQELVTQSSFDESHELYEARGRQIIFNKGNWQLKENLIIPSGYEVVFNAGTTLDMVDEALFISYSPIIMKGSAANPIRIMSSDFSARGFTVIQAESRSLLEHVIFENLNTLAYKSWVLTGAVNFYESDVDIYQTRFSRNQCEDALNIIRSNFLVSHSSFEHIFADAFDSDFCTGEVRNTNFTNIGNDAIDFSGSQIFIADCQIHAINDKGISAGENSQLTVERVNITHANIGLASKDLSTLVVSNSTVSDCNYGVVLLQKKPEYGSAQMILNQTKLLHSKTTRLIEMGSLLIHDSDTIKGDQKRLADIFYN